MVTSRRKVQRNKHLDAIQNTHLYDSATVHGSISRRITMVNHNGVSIYYVPRDGAEWARYLQEKLGHKEYDIQCEINDFTGQRSCHVISTKVNVFLVTPDFLECRNWDTLNEFNKDTCIFVLTGVDNLDFSAAAALYRSDYVLDWYIHELVGTEQSVREMILSIISIYESTDPLPCPEPCSVRSSRTGSGIYENANWDDDDVYDTLPPARQVNGLVETFCKDGEVHVVLLRRAEGNVAISGSGKSWSSELTECAVYRLPHCSGTGKISVTLDGNTIGMCCINQTSCIRHTTTVSTQTDSTTDENMNDKDTECNIYNNIVNRNAQNSCNEQTNEQSCNVDLNTQPHNQLSSLDKIREILEETIDPIGLLCQCLGIQKDLQSLDETLVTMMTNTMTSLRNLSFPGGHVTHEGAETSDWPTLLHFGARYNLSEFCETLLESPHAKTLCTRKNRTGQLPHNIARANGHLVLAEKLEKGSKFMESERDSRYDSGVSGFSVDLSRFSSTTLVEEAPPTPHRPSTNKNGYINMAVGNHSIERPDSSEDPFGNILEFSEIHGDENEQGKVRRRRGSVLSDMSLSSVEDSNDFRHKDLDNMLGLSSASEPKKGFNMFHFFKRSRSKSVPVEQSPQEIIQRRKAETKVYKRDSARSSGGTDSTASTHSDNSIKEEDLEPEVKIRGKKKQKEGKKLVSLLTKAQHRQSLRIKHAMAEQNLSVPTIPDRKLQTSTDVQDAF